jgi:hypothetical protein
MEKHETPKLQPLFAPGLVTGTHAAMEAMGRDPILAGMLLARHLSGDAGGIDEHDKRLNTDAIENGGRVMSSYELFNGPKIWIITEADRSVTTFLLPEEY